MSGITLHPEFGVNPSVVHCAACGKDYGVALLGRDDGTTIDAQGNPVALASVRAPVKYVGRPTAQELLVSVRQLARRVGSATVAQAGGIASITIDKPGKGSVVFHDGEPDPPDAPAQGVA